MAEITSDQERSVIRALTALDWTECPDEEAFTIIRSECKCSDDEARVILNGLVTRKAIRAESCDGGVFARRTDTP